MVINGVKPVQFGQIRVESADYTSPQQFSFIARVDGKDAEAFSDEKSILYGKFIYQASHRNKPFKFVSISDASVKQSPTTAAKELTVTDSFIGRLKEAVDDNEHQRRIAKVKKERSSLNKQLAKEFPDAFELWEDLLRLKNVVFQRGLSKKDPSLEFAKIVNEISSVPLFWTDLYLQSDLNKYRKFIKRKKQLEGADKK